MYKILIIDDDEDICHLFQKLLTKNSYDVATANSGKSGLKMLKEFKPDLVVTDFRLGDTDANSIIKAVKFFNDDIPIIVITGYSDIQNATDVMLLGATDYITKPLLPQQILTTIKLAFVVSGLSKK